MAFVLNGSSGNYYDVGNWSDTYWVSFWVRLGSVSGYQNFWYKTASNDAFQMNGANVDFWDGTKDTVGSTTLSTNTWYYMTVIRNGNTYVRVYINNTLEFENTTNLATVNSAAYFFAWEGAFDWLTGRVANIVIYNRLPTDDAERTSQMYRLLPVSTTNLWGWYNTMPGVHTVDYSGSGNTLTENGTVTDGDGPPVTWGAPVWVVGAPAGGPETIEATATDGLTFGESVARQAALLASITEGLNVGEAQTGQASLTSAISDGTTFSDTTSVTAAFTTALTDGLTLGEALTRVAAYVATATDGIVASDSTSTIAALLALSTDGLTLGESVASQVALLASAADGLTLGESLAASAILAALVADGVTFAEVLTGELAGDLSAIITDGIALGDTPSALTQLIATASDGTAFGDTVLASLAALATATDGLSFGDNAAGSIAAGVITALITDGLAFGDTGAIQAALTVSVSDGVQFAEAIQAISTLLATVTDGFSIGEVTFTVEAAGLVTVTFTNRQGSISFTVRQPAAMFTSRKPGVSFTGDS